MKPSSHTNFHQLRALLLKQITLQLRQKKTIVCQIVFPVLMLLFVFTYGAVFTFLGNKIGIKPVTTEYPPIELLKTIQTDLLLVPPILGNETLQYPIRIAYSAPDNVTRFLGSLRSDGVNSGFLGTFEQLETNKLEGLSYIPYAKQFHSQDLIDEYFYDKLKNDTLEGYFGALQFIRMDMNQTDGPVGMSYILQSPSSCEAFPMFNRLQRYGNSQVCAHGFRSYLMNAVHNAFVKYVVGNDSALKIRTSIQQMPETQSFNLAANTQDSSSQIIVLILLFPLPMFMYTLILEKTTRIREMMKLNGMSMKYYWISYYMFQIFIYLFFTCTFIWVFSMILQFRWSYQTNPIVLLVFFLACTANMMGFTMILSALINNVLLGIVIGYLIALFLPGIVVFINQFIIERSGYQFIWLLLFPPLPIDYALSGGIIRPCKDFRCPKWHTFGSWNPFTVGVIFMFANGIIYSLLGLYLDAVLPREWGVNKHPLFFLSPLKSLFIKVKRSATKEHRPLLNHREDESDDIAVNQEDSDVIEEEAKVARIVRSLENGDLKEQVPPIVINGLNKFYGSFQAVKNVSLSIESGTCFGLLGPNGAGKTTTCNVLCGLAKPSSGTAIINGFDIRTDMDLVHRSLGLAPQYEIVYDDLTVEEHLLFYTRLKGVPRSEEKMHIDVIMQSISLDSQIDRKKTAKQLSGGMRRRLSLGMALCGDPALVLMDEPTTGLDPTSRRQVWSIIQKQKEQGRCLILTTHSLDEADVLCDRIGIVQTTLKAIGSSYHLKNKFGQSYQLTMNYNPEEPNAISTIENFIRSEICSSAKASSQYTGNLSFDLLKDDVKISISEVFSTIEAFKTKNSNLIQEYNFSQTTLEDVFMSIVATGDGAPKFT